MVASVEFFQQGGFGKCTSTNVVRKGVERGSFAVRDTDLNQWINAGCDLCQVFIQQCITLRIVVTPKGYRDMATEWWQWRLK